MCAAFSPLDTIASSGLNCDWPLSADAGALERNGRNFVHCAAPPLSADLNKTVVVKPATLEMNLRDDEGKTLGE